MILDFRNWLERRQAPTINPEIKKWVDSADKLKQTVEKLKDIIKQHKKPERVKVEPKKPEREPEKIEPKKDEPRETKPEDKAKEVEDKENVTTPTKIEKEKNEEGLDRNGRRA
ncbi:MAG: hypothetical protein GTO02_00790 [Candidatus Dadabacteria bacterium]|nr:hypothetical protein [Candidatus Dadabacteria bacterium]